MSNKICIYGAGKYGEILLKYLKSNNRIPEFFLVSESPKSVDQKDQIDGIPVFSCEEIPEETILDFDIFVAVNDRLRADIIGILFEQYKNYDRTKIHYFGDEEVKEAVRKLNPVVKEKFLSNTSPVSRLFGCDRGKAIDRYYIEKFIEKESSRIENVKSTIEVGENTYSKAYFPEAVHDILDYSRGMDLTKPESVPHNKYDVFVCTQVFNFIYDIRAAIRGSYNLLKSGGVLLATVAGNISQVSRSDMENYGDYWRFTYLSIEKLVAEMFGSGNVRVEPFGNAMSAPAFVQGIALEEVDTNLLDETDRDYAICIGIVAKRV